MFCSFRTVHPTTLLMLAPNHTSHVVVDTIYVAESELLQHPTYSPDLASCDFYLFSCLKNHIHGRKFECNFESCGAQCYRTETVAFIIVILLPWRTDELSAFMLQTALKNSGIVVFISYFANISEYELFEHPS